MKKPGAGSAKPGDSTEVKHGATAAPREGEVGMGVNAGVRMPARKRKRGGVGGKEGVKFSKVRNSSCESNNVE
jgi:hypothetical protein